MSFYSSKAFTDLLLALKIDLLQSDNAVGFNVGKNPFFKKFLWLDFEVKNKAFYNWLDMTSKRTGIYTQILQAKTTLEEPKLHGYQEDIRKTIIINLTKTQEELFSNINENCRKNIRRGEKKGLTFREIATDEFEKYLLLLKATRKKLKLGMPPVYPMFEVWKKYPHNIKVFCIELNKEIIYAMTIFAAGDTITECAIAYNKAGRDLYAGDLMKWGVILWGKNNGFLAYDLAGVSESEPKIFAYKQKFGGQLVTFPVYTKTFSKSKDFIIKLKRKLL